MGFVKDLNTPLLRVSKDDVISVGECCEGIHYMAASGAGKTSSMWVVLVAFLRSLMGGLVTAVKPDTIPQLREVMARSGLGNSLIVFDQGEDFNFLDWELARHGWTASARSWAR